MPLVDALAGAAEDQAFAGNDLAEPIALVLRGEAVEPLGRRMGGLDRAVRVGEQ